MHHRRHTLIGILAMGSGMLWSTQAVAQTANAAALDEFFTAVMRDNYRGITTQLLRGLNPNTPDARGRTGLTLAIRQESWQVVDTLLVAPGIDINLPNKQGETPLMLAAIKGNLPLVKQLIAKGADVNRAGWTPLHYAASAGLEHSVEIAAYLLDKSAYIDAPSPNGTTPLMLAAQYSSDAMVRLLLAEGADLSLRNQQGFGAVEFAEKSERDFMVKMLQSTHKARNMLQGKW